MKFYLAFLLSLFVFISCDKKIEYANSTDSEVFINAKFSNDSAFQEISVYGNRAINLGSNLNPIKNVSLEISQLGNTYLFTDNNMGIYTSNQKFSLVSGENFTVKYIVDTATFSDEYATPYPIKIDTLNVSDGDFFIKLSISIESPVDQYLTYQIFQRFVDTTFSDSTFVDTTWNENIGELPFSIVKVNAGMSEIALSPKDSYNTTDIGEEIKIVIKAITKETSDYLNILNNYIETIATSSLYVNPPRFYSNHFYGSTYAYSSDSVTVML